MCVCARVHVEGVLGKETKGVTDTARWYCLECPLPKTTQEEELAISTILALERQISSTF